MDTIDKIINWKNGNADITLHEDGTRIIDFDGELKLDWPLNIDIRVSTECSFADTVCKGFCHESAVTKGKEALYGILYKKLKGLPAGTELAIGCNKLTPNLMLSLPAFKLHKWIVNLTINQGHLRRDLDMLKLCIDRDLIKGLGVSYRPELIWYVPDEIVNYPNTVFHVIAGIDSIEDVLKLKQRGVKKVLVLGEKDFGYNTGKVNLNSRKHKEWFWWVSRLFKEFDVVSFDNLALEQLSIRRFFNDEKWSIFNQGEHSFYIDAVNQTFAPSSRSADKVSWDGLSIQQYFKSIDK